ncbi:sensor histidine kinase [Paenibacillus glucanolyticus]|uniref:sensor histidine kinase n=1 Tax=Paenibacillus glucanolyticus TaxID=59843 RepID=UPI0015C3484C|nr:sensor histidine kinase [Paenibacillus glucanolyticus]
MRSGWRIAVFLIIVIALSQGYPRLVFATEETAARAAIKEWRILWSESGGIPESVPAHREDWTETSAGASEPSKPNAKTSAWIHMKIPEITAASPGILIEKLHGQQVAVYADHVKVYESTRAYNYELNHILLPLDKELLGKDLHIWLETARDHVTIEGKILVGEYHDLLNQFVKSNLVDIILGSAFVFIAFVMLICAIFLNRKYLIAVLSLSFIVLSVGILVFTYSPFLYTIFDEYGHIYTHLYDISLFILLPSFSLFFEKIFGLGWKNMLHKLRKFQVVYSLFCGLFLVVNQLASNQWFDLYYFFSVQVMGFVMIIQFILLIGSSMFYAFRGNRDAVIFNAGFAVFAVIGLGELLQFFMTRGSYNLFLWKWGIVSFIIALIVILGRHFAKNHEQILQYSKELEMFNNELQRSEKMEIISELAASVAHEVRNPLQVTRGFLQLLTGKAEAAEREYLDLALVELDRASGIITDFLTFAKPEFGKDTLLQISEEFKHIEGILAPLAHLQGGRITVDIPEDITIRGNSSKFKQAFINIIKNSIEALGEEGVVHIRCYRQQNQVFIHVVDNGEGMGADVIARLGEPYFSNKTKGTGLGLMVTFRIIEAMDGDIFFTSRKGVGTDAIITLPAACE